MSQINDWEQTGVIIGDGDSDWLGGSVAINANGDRIITGANSYHAFSTSSNGYAYVYRWNDVAWIQTALKINSEQQNSLFGWSVAMDGTGTRIAIGAPLNSAGGNARGKVKIYDYNFNNIEELYSTYDTIGNTLNGVTDNEQFGYSLAMSNDGNTVVAGTPFSNSKLGHVRVHRWNGSDWQQLGNPITGTVENERFGHSVNITSDGNRIVVGSNEKDGPVGIRNGCVRVYDWNETTWVQVGNDIDGKQYNESSGHSVAINSDGSRIVIGANLYDVNDDVRNIGAARVYKKTDTDWEQVGNDIIGESAQDCFGYSVDINNSGTIIAVGADSHNSGRGQVSSYHWNGNTWMKVGGSINGQNTGDNLGTSVAINSDGTKLITGADSYDKGGVSNQQVNGQVRMYTYDLLRTISLTKGWNMIGTSGNSFLTDPFNIIIDGTLYHYGGTEYGDAVDVSALESNKGYWLKSNENGEINLFLSNAVSEGTRSIPVVNGWNMIGLSSDGQITDSSNIIVDGTLYHYNGTEYGDAVDISALESNKGYWLKCNSNGNIEINL